MSSAQTSYIKLKDTIITSKNGHDPLTLMELQRNMPTESPKATFEDDIPLLANPLRTNPIMHAKRRERSNTACRTRLTKIILRIANAKSLTTASNKSGGVLSE